MSYGQYSNDAQPRRSKSGMVAELSREGRAVTSAKLVARNTLDYTTPDGVRRVRLHDTDIVTVQTDGSVVINTGGWNTLTTRDRINNYAPGDVRIYTDKGTPYARLGHGWEGGVPFESTVTVTPGGKIIADKTPEQLRILPKMIDRYIKAMKATYPIRNDKGEPDSAGDPWMITGSIPSHDVALDWLGAGPDSDGDPYIFNTIVYHAFKASGMQDIGAEYWYRQAVTGKLSAFITGKVRRYFRKALGI